MCPGPKVGGDFIGGQYRANREAATQGFGGAENIGCYAVMLVGKQFARMPPCRFALRPKSAKRRVVAQTACGLKIFLGGRQDAAFALNRLDNHGAGFVADGCFQCGNIIEGNVGNAGRAAARSLCCIWAGRRRIR